jgi:translation initiation factor IF-2
MRPTMQEGGAGWGGAPRGGAAPECKCPGSGSRGGSQGQSSKKKNQGSQPWVVEGTSEGPKGRGGGSERAGGPAAAAAIPAGRLPPRAGGPGPQQHASWRGSGTDGGRPGRGCKLAATVFGVRIRKGASAGRRGRPRRGGGGGAPAGRAGGRGRGRRGVCPWLQGGHAPSSGRQGKTTWEGHSAGTHGAGARQARRSNERGAAAGGGQPGWGPTKKG